MSIGKTDRRFVGDVCFHLHMSRSRKYEAETSFPDSRIHWPTDAVPQPTLCEPSSSNSQFLQNFGGDSLLSEVNRQRLLCHHVSKGPWDPSTLVSNWKLGLLAAKRPQRDTWHLAIHLHVVQTLVTLEAASPFPVHAFMAWFLVTGTLTRFNVSSSKSFCLKGWRRCSHH